MVCFERLVYIPIIELPNALAFNCFKATWSPYFGVFKIRFLCLFSPNVVSLGRKQIFVKQILFWWLKLCCWFLCLLGILKKQRYQIISFSYILSNLKKNNWLKCVQVFFLFFWKSVHQTVEIRFRNIFLYAIISSEKYIKSIAIKATRICSGRYTS